MADVVYFTWDGLKITAAKNADGSIWVTFRGYHGEGANCSFNCVVADLQQEILRQFRLKG